MCVKCVWLFVGKPVNAKDVHNLIQQINNEIKREKVDRRGKNRTNCCYQISKKNCLVQHLLEEFSAEQGNVSEVLTRADGETVAIIFQTKEMRKMLSRFHEVILVDTTYTTNSSRYKLFSFMVTDAFGKGQFVQHSFVDSETIDVLRSVLQIFKKNNPCTESSKVFVVDKDMKEEAAINQVFEDARVLLCQFHVIKWFNSNKVKYDLSSEEVTEMRITISR
jgi:hypothetical protein